MPLDSTTRDWLTLNNAPSLRERMLTYNGATRSIKQWSIILNLPSPTIRKRLSRGWAVEKVLETELKVNKYI